MFYFELSRQEGVIHFSFIVVEVNEIVINLRSHIGPLSLKELYFPNIKSSLHLISVK